MWLGESTHTLDGKHRVFVPKRFLGGLVRDNEGRTPVVLTRGFEGCLFLFSEGNWAEIVAGLNTRAFAGPEERKMQRLFFSKANYLHLDGSGRLLIPENLRSLVGIDREIEIVGAHDRLEIWPKAAWDAYCAENSGEFDRLDQVLRGPAAEQSPQP